MSDYELSRNGSKYYDPTAYQAMKEYIKSEEKKMELYEGDIFRAEMNNGTERVFVILSVHNDFSTVLMLSDNEALPYSIKCNGLMYTNPGMISYVFNDKFIGLIRSLKKDEYNDLMQEVVAYLGCSAPKKAESKPVMAKSNNVDHPSHYQGKNECIDVMIALFGLEAVKAFCKCNAYKYRFRSSMKNGAEDIEKAEWYESKLIALEGD